MSDIFLASALSSPPSLVLVYGDSITEALDLPQADRGNRWTDVIERESNGRLQLINEGKGGRPTDALHEFEAVLARNPRADVFVIALGANDARDISDACVPKAIANLRTMISRVREVYTGTNSRADTLSGASAISGAAVRLLIVAPTNIRKDALGPTRPIANERDGKLCELGTAFLALANEAGCAFVSTYGVVRPESLTVDGVHPDRAGHAAIAAVLLPKLLEITSPLAAR